MSRASSMLPAYPVYYETAGTVSATLRMRDYFSGQTIEESVSKANNGSASPSPPHVSACSPQELMAGASGDSSKDHLQRSRVSRHQPMSMLRYTVHTSSNPLHKVLTWADAKYPPLPSQLSRAVANAVSEANGPESASKIVSRIMKTHPNWVCVTVQAVRRALFVQSE